MKNLIVALMALFVSASSIAQEKQNKNAKYDIPVSGNCDQCKKRIEKAAFSVKGVKSAIWDQNDQVLHVIVNEEKASADQVRSAVAAAGHDTDKVRSADKDYDNLHTCCKYPRSPKDGTVNKTVK